MAEVRWSSKDKRESVSNPTSRMKADPDRQRMKQEYRRQTLMRLQRI